MGHGWMVVRQGRGIWLLLLRLGDSREGKERKGEISMR